MSAFNPYQPPVTEAPVQSAVWPQEAYSVPAGFWIRVVATIVDGLVLLPITLLSFANFLLWKSVLVQLLITLPGLLYKPLMEATAGATLGKRAVGLVVIGENGRYPSLGQAYLRYAPWLLTTAVATANTLMIFADPSFAGVDDFMAMSTVEQPLQVPMNLMNLVFVGGCIMAGVTANKRALHDYLAKTFVIYRPS